MVGTHEECEQFVTEIHVINPETKRAVFKSCFNPRPIKRDHGHEELCLSIKLGNLAKIWMCSQLMESHEFEVSVKIQTL